MAEWADIKKVLDDPNVSMEKKQKLMESYDNDKWNFNAEQEEYAKKYIENYSDGDGVIIPIGSDSDVDEALKEAQAEAKAKGQETQAETDRRDQAKKNVDSMPAPALGGTTKSSDEMLDQGNVTVDWLAKWVDEVWNHRTGQSGNLNSQTDIKDKFHENRGIQFQKFLTEADDLNKAHKVVEDTLTNSDTELQTLFGEWKGKGANAAQIKYDETVKPHAKELQDQIAGAAKLIPETVTHVYDSLKKKIDEVLALQRPAIAEATIPMAKDVLKVANGETEEFDDFMKVASWIDACNKKAGMDSNLADRLQNDDGCFNDENIQYGRDVTRFWRDGPFRKEFESIINAFNGSCKTAKDTIDQQFGALATFMDGYRNQLTEQPGKTGDPGKKDDGKTGDGSGKGNGNGNGTGSGTGSGSGSTTPSAAEPPKAEEPPKPEDGKNPITGKPLEVDPDTGQPYPIDPKTGEAIKDDGKTETVSVKKGDNTIEMSEPDKEGKMDVKVDDGAGHQKDYKLDFDDDKGDAKDGKTDAAGKDGSFGPQGSPQAVKEGQPSADGAYKPGPDGKIHIQDGDLKITAERPEGPDGPTVVTVDDGKGEPTTYTLDEKDGDKPELKADDAKTDGAKPDDLKSDAKDPASDNSSQVQHDKDAESPLTKDPAPANPDPGMTAGVAGGNGFSTPGGLDLEGDLGGAEPADAGGGAGGGGGTGDATTTAGAEGLGAAVSGSTSGTLGDAVSLEPGAHSGSDAALPSSDGGLGMTPGGDPGASHTAVAGATSGGGMSGMGGMGMMGGMGGAPGGGGGGDTQRGSSQYRVEGNVFETSGAKGRISGSLDDDDGDRSIRYDR